MPASFRSFVALMVALLAILGPTPATAGPAPAPDARFHAMFDSWKRLDQVHVATAAIAIPSQKPLREVTISSGFGVRSDPFRSSAAMHAGVDMQGAVGTPVYATADGVVVRAEWSGGYGNLVEIDHGKGIATRYGHLSQIAAQPNTRVKRGDLIGLMGSTGRSTGSHLHYEVRIDGRAVNPMPFLEGDDYMLAMNRRDAGLENKVALGGPDLESGDE